MLLTREMWEKKVFDLLALKGISSLVNGVSAILFTPRYLLKHPIAYFSVKREIRKARRSGKKVLLISLAVPMEVQFIRGALQLLSTRPEYAIFIFAAKKRTSRAALSRELPNFPIYPFGLLATCRGDLFISTATWLGWCKPRKVKRVHVLHSLASLHIYPKGTFDDFQVLLAKGPHHVDEFREYASKRGLHSVVFPIGCERVDALYAQRQPSRERIQEVLYAPSYGATSSLAMYGREIVKTLLDLGVQVTLRPHIQSYRQDAETLESIEHSFGQNPHFRLDRAENTNLLSPTADLLISDWSGAAFEFALGYEKPVLFMNTPRKTFNPRWRELFSRDGIEVTHRTRVGYVLSGPKDLPWGVEEVNRRRQQLGDGIRAALCELLCYRGEGARHTVQVIDQLTGLTTSPPRVVPAPSEAASGFADRASRPFRTEVTQ